MVKTSLAAVPVVLSMKTLNEVDLSVLSRHTIQLSAPADPH